MGRNCVPGMNEPASPLSSCRLWEWSLFCRDFGFPHANVRLGNGPCDLFLPDQKSWSLELSLFPPFCSHTLWTHRCCINIWWIEHWHPFLCTLFLFCILMHSFNQNTLPKLKEKNGKLHRLQNRLFIYSYYRDFKSPHTNRCRGNKRHQWVWVTGRIAGCKPTRKLWSWNQQNPLAVSNLFTNEKNNLFCKRRMTKKRVKPYKLRSSILPALESGIIPAINILSS